MRSCEIPNLPRRPGAGTSATRREVGDRSRLPAAVAVRCRCPARSPTCASAEPLGSRKAQARAKTRLGAAALPRPPAGDHSAAFLPAAQGALGDQALPVQRVLLERAHVVQSWLLRLPLEGTLLVWCLERLQQHLKAQIAHHPPSHRPSPPLAAGWVSPRSFPRRLMG